MLTSKDNGSTDNNLPSLSRSCGDKTIIQVYQKENSCSEYNISYLFYINTLMNLKTILQVRANCMWPTTQYWLTQCRRKRQKVVLLEAEQQTHWINVVTTLIIWQTPWAGKVNRIEHCDWLLERAGWSYLARSGLPAVSCEKNVPESQIIIPLLTKLFRSRWLDIDLVLFSFASLSALPPHGLGPWTRKKERG